MVVFNGTLKNGTDADDVKTKLARIFNVSRDRIEPFFTGSQTVIKGNLEKDAACKYKQVIEQTGALCRIIEEQKQSPLSLSISGDSEREIKQLPVCPKCGYQAQGQEDPLITKHDGMGECPVCGIIVEKYMKSLKDVSAGGTTEEDDDEDACPSIDDDNYAL